MWLHISVPVCFAIAPCTRQARRRIRQKEKSRSVLSYIFLYLNVCDVCALHSNISPDKSWFTAAIKRVAYHIFSHMYISGTVWLLLEMKNSLHCFNNVSVSARASLIPIKIHVAELAGQLKAPTINVYVLFDFISPQCAAIFN